MSMRSRGEIPCTWKAGSGSVSILPHSSLDENKLNLHIELTENSIETARKNNVLGITQMLGKIFETESPYVCAQSFSLSNGTITVVNNNSKQSFEWRGSLAIKKNSKSLWQGRLNLLDGNISYDKKPVLKSLMGILHFSQQDSSTQPFHLSSQLSFFSTHLSEQNRSKLKLSSDGKNIKATGNFVKNGIIGMGKLETPIDLSHGSYEVILKHPTTQKKTSCAGNFYRNNKKLTVVGKSILGSHNIKIDLANSIQPEKITLSKKNKTVATITRDLTKNTYSGKASYSYLQAFLPIQVKKWFFGTSGKVEFQLKQKDFSQFSGKLLFRNGRIQIPSHYNLFTSLESRFELDLEEKSITLDDIFVRFLKGTIESKQTIAHWNKSNEISFFHAPLQIKNFLVNYKNDFFGLVTGNIFITQKAGKPYAIDGDIVVKKSLLKENIFAHSGGERQSVYAKATTRRGFFSPLLNKTPLTLNLNILSQEPIAVKTTFLQTQASIDLNLNLNSTEQLLLTPQVTGSITLNRGLFTFPRNSLSISSGKIYFIHNQMNNPMINLVAQNRIKKYLVTLQISGYLEKPTIFLTSNPTLSEEQIVSLLFAGSENATLRTNLPSIIMQNLHTMLLGGKHQQPQVSRFFKHLTKPLKYVQIVPSFTDQSGRGGVRGNISVNLNKRLHAQIQKNFTMQDDLAFQLEYFLSDDVHVKAIKDQRGDIGAEVEVRIVPLSL